MEKYHPYARALASADHQGQALGASDFGHVRALPNAMTRLLLLFLVLLAGPAMGQTPSLQEPAAPQPAFQSDRIVVEMRGQGPDVKVCLGST